jgi:hypothetical protein
VRGTPDERFFAKVERRDGHLIWTGARSKGSPTEDPYGVFWDGTDRVKAHRWAYERWVGPIPDGHLVRHSCDITLCVDFEHLLTGTNADNMADMVRRGRSPVNRGERNPNRKLTAEDAVAIRLRAGAGESRSALAMTFGVTTAMIGRIVRGVNWLDL